jgi:3-phenylpropionate/trans-cinnamate dioxygenase ferredoxin reductase subunit
MNLSRSLHPGADERYPRDPPQWNAGPMTQPTTAGPTSYVVVGGGLAGAKAAEAIRAGDAEGTVTLIGAEARRPYERPELSKGVIGGKKTPDDLFVHDEGWYGENRVDLMLGARVAAVDREGATVALEDGRVVPYDRLLLATGATPRRLNAPGADLPGVHYLRTAEDSAALLAAITSGSSLVVVGGGWIGLEVAAGAREKGLQVTVVEPQPTPLFAVMGAEVGELWAQLHRDHGVDVRCGVQVRAVQEVDGRAGGVVLDDDQVLSADVVLVGVGAAPNLELAEQAGLATEGGVHVDGRLRTEDPRIWAAGDIALADNAWAGRALRVEHWANAKNQGAFAGRSMTGASEEWADPPYFFTDQYDAGMEYWGWADPREGTVVVRGRPADGEYVVAWVSTDGHVDSAMHVNRWDDSDAVKALVQSKVRLDVERFQDTAVALTDLS